MERPDDAAAIRRVGPVATVWRGMRRRCGRCGGRRLFAGWFRLKDRCPTCGYTFRREEGFWTGVFLVNFAVTEGLMFVVLMSYVLVRAASDTGGALWPVLTGCLGFAVLGPVLYYPFATTTWAALDLVLRPLEPEEEADAATWAASAR